MSSTCPCCGSPVRVVGDGTMHYVPDTTERDHYRAALERIESYASGTAVYMARRALSDPTNQEDR